VNENPSLEVTVDVEAQEIRFGNHRVKATVRESARDALIHGRWDAIAELLEGLPATQARAQLLPYLAV
jgi:3-isopropylmalate/(R)-2-methylmalate dehydratase small subunit